VAYSRWKGFEGRSWPIRGGKGLMEGRGLFEMKNVFERRAWPIRGEKGLKEGRGLFEVERV
jgi:hypothetical protein